MSWIPVDPQFIHGTLRGYKVRFKEHAQLNVAEWIVKTVNSTTQQVELTGVKPQTMYEVQVLAFTIKDGNYSESAIVVTQKRRKYLITCFFFFVICLITCWWEARWHSG